MTKELDPIDDLNGRAFKALLGLSVSWREDLVALLRSDTPITIAVREQLADIIEGKEALTLDLKGHERTARRLAGLDARRQWFNLGERVAAIVTECATVSEAFAEAEVRFGLDHDRCRKHFYYFRHCSDWTEQAAKSGTFYPHMSAQELQTVWHLASIDQRRERPSPPTAKEFDGLRGRRLRSLLELFRDWEHAHLAASAFTIYCEMLPPDED